MNHRLFPKVLLVCGVLVVGLFLVNGLNATSKPGWIDNQTKAMEKAKTDKKLVLMDFTGSDWCGWCKKLDKEVFSTPEFQKYAKENLVLVELDFPRNTYISPQTKTQNEKLAKEYSVEGYPTIVVLNAEGKKVGQLGYMPGGPKAFIAELDKLKNS